ncbi:MAG: matrixin family metalloprotease [Gammaproteobacteria bacterium]|jgi:hypothetical protein|nr:matrixin family metalloprotease [Gammaproteobacteria bacterium]MBT4892918.1 matrixin family metalloprotease [Gammaproteobacteria bacterium]
MKLISYSLIVITLLLSLSCSRILYAYEIDGRKWIGGTTDFYVDIQGIAPSGITWNTAFIAAMNDWSEETLFDFNLIQQAIDPCLSDGLNGVEFTSDLCGSEFGERTLAVTLNKSRSQILGSPAITEADIVINQSKEFNIYDGRLIQSGIQGLDFRRVALHELGHVIGLDHEDGLPSMMSSSIGNIDRITEDDITGVNALYSGLSNCNIKQLRFGSVADGLSDADCTVDDLTVGGGDTSYIDLYRFELSNPTTVNFSMSSSTLDSVLILSDQNLRYLAYDDKSSELCDSSLSKSLPAGSYFLLSNTYDVPVKETCGNTGDYVLTASYSSNKKAGLGNSASLNGGFANASFVGGISADNGQNFGNHFRANQSLDISATINVDPAHQGQSGFLVAAAIVGEQILFLNENGEFVDSAAFPGIIVKHRNLLLSAEELITLATNLIPADLGIQEIEVDFYTGYGLDSDPEELYFNQLPMNLTVSPQ